VEEGLNQKPMENPMEKKSGKNRFLMFSLVAIGAFAFSLLFYFIHIIIYAL
jgi:hypothetical protein